MVSHIHRIFKKKNKEGEKLIETKRRKVVAKAKQEIRKRAEGLGKYIGKRAQTFNCKMISPENLIYNMVTCLIELCFMFEIC